MKKLALTFTGVFLGLAATRGLADDWQVPQSTSPGFVAQGLVPEAMLYRMSLQSLNLMSDKDGMQIRVMAAGGNGNGGNGGGNGQGGNGNGGNGNGGNGGG